MTSLTPVSPLLPMLFSERERPMRPTIRDVAQHAGVSIKTVSRVLNDEPYVREDTRARVLATINDLGFVANLLAKRFAKG